MSIEPILTPLPGERVLGLSPRNRDGASDTWLRRPNLFPGRTLTHETLKGRSAWARGRLAHRGQAFVPGVVHGLELGWTTRPGPAGPGEDEGPAEAWLTLAPGMGLAASGEDVSLTRASEVRLRDLEFVAPPDVLEGGGFGAEGTLQPRKIAEDVTLGTFMDERPGALPSAGVLVLQPAVFPTRDVDADDPCVNGCGDAIDFDDARMVDAARLLWYAWPIDWRPLPPAGARQRNRIAYTVFEAEGELQVDGFLPWEDWGVPLGILVLGADGLPVFADRASVVRRGGRGRAARLHLPRSAPDDLRLVGSPRNPTLWQARIEQLAEEIAGLSAAESAPAALARRFDTLPPCGLLPRDAVDFTAGRSDFFPAATELDAVPIPLDQLDLAFRESAGLAPIELARSERVRVLVPVDAASWDPGLLQLEVLDPEFQQTLDRFLVDRGRALAGRQATRIKSSALLKALKGDAPPVPAIGDDPQAVETETLGAWGPPAGARWGHRTGVAPGEHGHGFTRARDAFVPARGDTLFTWVYLDPEHAPRTLMLEWRGPNGSVHRAYWGDNLIDRGTDGRVTRLRLGDLPATGRWVRMDVPAATMEYEGTELRGMGFAVYGGRAAFSATGAASGDRERVWFEGPVPPGASVDEGGSFDVLSANELLAPCDLRYGVRVADEKQQPVSTTLEGLAADSRLAFLSGAERRSLGQLGIEGFIRFLADRADRADDLVDYGFLKVQTDIYRVRQFVLDASDATRLAVSPTLAGIAKGETATASQRRISDFFTNLKSAKDDQEIEPDPGGTNDPGGGGAPVLFNASALFDHGDNSDLVRLAAGSFRTGSHFNLGTKSGAPTVSDVVKAQTLTQPLFKASLYTPKDITNAQPLVGKFDLRTISIAKRLEEPKAWEAREYAAGTRQEAVMGLIRLADDLVEKDGEVPGLFKDIDVWGLNDETFTAGGESSKGRIKFGKFLDGGLRTELLTQLKNPPQRTKSDEAALFSDTADLGDRTVALLRQVEGRIRAYRVAIAACETASAALRDDLTAARKQEVAWGQALGEARHDVSVARALIAEEEARLDAINARRAEILEREVTFLAFVRPRTVDSVEPAPVRALDPGLLAAPAPTCLKERAVVPEELDDILAVVREAPSDWFRLQRRLLDGLVKVGALMDAVRTAQLRTSVLETRVTRVPATATRITAAMSALKVRQTARLAPVRVQSQSLDVSRLAALSWRSVRAQAAEVVSLGDLIEGAHRNGQVARDAAAFFERFSRICGCLYEAFSEVTPSIRLDWAEILSEFDGDANLRNLSGLPRFAEIEFEDRRRMQGLVDWLFDQVDPEEVRSVDLVDDVVRMCLLVASHAPVGRILAGYLPRPVTVRPGLKIPLVAVDPDRLRVGMQAVLSRGSRVVARAVVEDFVSQEASARVSFAAEASMELGTDVRVQFTEALGLGR